MLGKTLRLRRTSRRSPRATRNLDDDDRPAGPRGDARGGARVARGPADLLERHRPRRALRARSRAASAARSTASTPSSSRRANAGRLERVYPELVHHFSQADVPEKTVEYALKLAQKSLDAFSAEDAVRVAKIALDYLEDAEDAEDRKLEGEARLLLAQGHRLAGNIDAALREAEAAVRVFEAEKQPSPGGRRRPARGGDRLAGPPDRRRAPVGRARDRDARARAATRSTWRGCFRSPRRSPTCAASTRRPRRTRPRSRSSRRRQKAAEEELPRGGTLVVAVANPIAATEPGLYETNEEQEVLANVFERLVTTDLQGNLAPGLCEKWTFEDDGLAVRLHLRPGVVFSDGAPLTAAAVKALARALDPAFAGPDARGLRRHPRRRRVRGRARPRASKAFRPRPTGRS